jgi:hypothetical protein
MRGGTSLAGDGARRARQQGRDVEGSTTIRVAGAVAAHNALSYRTQAVVTGDVETAWARFPGGAARHR